MLRREAAKPEMGIEMSAGRDATQMAENAWVRVKRRLRAELGEDVFTSWLARLELDKVCEGCATLSVPTRFLKSWIEAQYLDRIVATFASEEGGLTGIAVVVRSGIRDPAAILAGRGVTFVPAPAAMGAGVPAGGTDPASDTAQTAVASVRPERARSDIAGAPLDGRLTFESSSSDARTPWRRRRPSGSCARKAAARSTTRSTSRPASVSARRICCMPPATRRPMRGAG